MLKLITSSSVLALSLSLFAVACGSAPSERSSSGGQAVTGPSGPASNVDPAFAVCGDDTDCVAVPQAGCCHNGWLDAVSSVSVDDYNAANACTQPPAACPMYVVNDLRVAQCNGDSKVCEMIAPEKIDCGDIHACPTGFTCNRGEERGACVKDSAN